MCSGNRGHSFKSCVDFFFQTSMSAHPRYHSRDSWAGDRGNWSNAAGPLERPRGHAYRHWEWRDTRWRRPPPRGWSGRWGPRRFSGTPPGRTFQGTPQPWQWGPRFRGDMRWGDNFQRSPSRSCPWDGKSRGLPRRGPPVAAIRVPSWYWPEEGGKRGSLVGSNHEALCGEAPKGQPVIRREPFEAVCVEAR